MVFAFCMFIVELWLPSNSGLHYEPNSLSKYVDTFCLDEISFRRDYKSCRVDVVVRRSFVVPQLWELCDGITFVILELHFWDLVHCLLISFCFGSEILKKIGPPQPQKKPQKTPK